MKRIIFFFLGISLVAYLINCTEKTIDPDYENVLIDHDLFENGPDDQLSITSVYLTNDCLTIEFLAAGCDGNEWIIKLIDAGMIAESNPPQRMIRLSLDNPEQCRKGITKEITFNLGPVRINGGNKVLLNLEGWEEDILYSY